MQELQLQLGKCETAIVVNFNHLNHRVWCYVHIINICSSHIVASMTPTSKSYLSQLKVPTDSNYVTCNDFNNELDDGDINLDHDLHQLEPADFYDNRGDPKLRRWFLGIKHDPIRWVRRVVHILCSSDQCREGLRAFIQDGNRRNWFSKKDSDGTRIAFQVPELQLLRDMKTQWDSVYMMLERLRQLQPVGLLCWLDSGDYSD